jgi:hypothetical protein
MRKINVDIHYDFAKAVMVVAKNKDEAIRIVEEKLRKGEIDPRTFEPTGDYELETDWQPEEDDVEEYYKTHKV